MIIIKTACKECGEVLLRSYDIQLHLTPDEAAGYYQFRCPNCGKTTSGEADHQFIKVLLANGIKPIDDVIPIDTELTWDDYLDFVLDLKRGKFEKEVDAYSDAK